ncbi:hypothetical protein FHS31_001867 [Sphingomonas vulcanisoli]|uniref:Ribbon-helix-helix protein, CopG family n=1 Tax=Sphingomonas vulcanisoli TaxID=1658060 RepID=A0ABX0TV72_9SPHN|nr:hypothetical protein [Sphingomonas vulcanisoli]
MSVDPISYVTVGMTRELKSALDAALVRRNGRLNAFRMSRSSLMREALVAFLTEVTTNGVSS